MYNVLEQKLRFKCEVCHRNGLTLVERTNGQFQCVCGNVQPRGFWKERFKGASPILTLMEANTLIGANHTGSALRKAILAGKLPAEKVNSKLHRIRRDDLIEYYARYYRKRPSYQRKAVRLE